jgi:hypothetical protein
MPNALHPSLLNAGFQKAPVVFLLMVDILPVGVGGLRVGVGYGVGVLLLAVVVASGREGVGLGLDFGNSDDGVRHGAVGKGIRQAA